MKKKSSVNSNKTPYAIIFTHMEDLDGIVSGALAYYYYSQFLPKNHITVEILNYREIETTIQKYIANWESLFISISDLGLNPKFIALLQSLPMKAQLKRPHIYIDHHEINGDLTLIKNKFSEYLNPLVYIAETERNRAGFLEPVSSNVSYEYYSKQQEKSFPNHFKELVNYAYQTDHEGQISNKPEKRAIQLKQYISFYQMEKSELYKLIEVFVDEKQYLEFIDNLDRFHAKINGWYEEQKEIIRNHVQSGEFQSLSYVHVLADLRSGEITNYLQELFPNKDIYIGLSWRERYMNLRTKAPIAAEIAKDFGGGGHKDRSGFLIPEKYLDVLKKQQKPINIPIEFVQEIVNGYLNHLS